jgi:glutathione S-transferase
MSLTLHYHPLSSFCQKALIGLYEVGVPFERNIVDLGNERQRAALSELWPMGKFPVLSDAERDCVVVESTTILEYLDQHHRDRARLVPEDAERARECRFRDRFFDLYVNTPMGKIVTDRLRPEAERDAFGVEQARKQLQTAYGFAEARLCTHRWAIGDDFTMADCAAAPALYYAELVLPFCASYRRLASYYGRLAARPSFARALREAEPYRSLFPPAT